MNALEFTIELTGASEFRLPENIVAQLPKTGKARVILLPAQTSDESRQTAAYQQFLRDDSPEDEIYETLR
jgi:hypothetical protein